MPLIFAIKILEVTTHIHVLNVVCSRNSRNIPPKLFRIKHFFVEVASLPSVTVFKMSQTTEIAFTCEFANLKVIILNLEVSCF